MRTVLVVLAFAAATAAPIGCAFGARTELGKEGEADGSYAPRGGPFAAH